VTRRRQLAHQRARNARSPVERRRSLAWSALIVVASLVGGLAAAGATQAITHKSDNIAVLLSLAVAAIVVVALYFGLLDDKQPESGQQHVSQPDGYRGPLVPPTMPMQAPGNPGEVPRPLPPPEPVRPAVVRVLPGPSSPAWWQGQGSAGPAPRGARSTGPRSVPLSEFLDQALIAQCPRCGSFRVGADNRPAEWHFGCEECGARWTWQPGSPWPAVQVRPNARRRAD
jgi:hypothetical protein